jgi:hypothetical protein
MGHAVLNVADAQALLPFCRDTLGRHTNDHMTSFHDTTPSGFFVANRWGARVIAPAAWQPHETFDGPS